METSFNPLKFIPLIIIGLVIYVIFGPKTPAPPLRPVVASPGYDWPIGCQQDDYGSNGIGSIIPCACAVEKYSIPDWKNRGLRTHVHSAIMYYRVANDAIAIGQYAFGFHSGECYIQEISNNFYRAMNNHP